MPIYEYLCEGCGRITEVMHKISERGPESCGECGSEKIARLVSRSAFQLKGGGWYADLYSSAKKGAKDGASSSGSGSSASASASDNSSSSGAKPEGGGAAEKKPAAAPAGEKKP